jgi:hypothetical protein
MPHVGFDPTIAVFERAKTFRALDLRGHCDRPIEGLVCAIVEVL